MPGRKGGFAVDFFLFEKFALTRLRQRCQVEGDACRVRRKRGGWVMLSRAEWDEIRECFAARIAPSGKALRWSIWLAIPFAIAVLALLSSVPPIHAALNEIDGTPGFLLWLVISCGLPVTMAALHIRAVRRALAEVESRLGGRARCEAPAALPPKAISLFEILALVFVGPHLVVEIIGTLDPNAFLNTPWSGTSLDSYGYAGLAIFAVLGGFRLRRMRPFARTATAAEASTGRRTDAFARAREADA
jgi:hypothetical protein